MPVTDTFDATRQVTWVMNDGDLHHLLAAIESSVEVVMDHETTGLDEHATTGGRTNGGVAARIVLTSLTLPQPDDAGEPTTWVVPLSHPESPWRGEWRAVLRHIARTIVEADRPLINQNVKFDARWTFALTGVDLTGQIVWDTEVGSHLLDELASRKLKDRAPQVFGIERWDEGMEFNRPGEAEEKPLFDLGLYAARDTYWTWRLAKWQRERMFLDGDPGEPESSEEVEDARLGRLAVWAAMPTAATLTAIEQRGLRLDTAWVRQQIAEHEAERAELFAELSTRYPALDPERASFAPTAIWFRDWAAAAVEAGDLTVAALTPKGKPQWSRHVLGRQARNGSEVAEKLLALRGHIKKLEFLRAWLGYVTPEGRIHSTYNVGSVVTGRLSSSDPNMQQVTKVLRPAFLPSEGRYIADLDYSQIELRVAAFIADSLPMRLAFEERRDLHTLLASRITGKHAEQVTPDERQKGKSANFGLLYMMGPYGFREYAEDVYGVVMTIDEAVEVHRAFFEMWDGIAQWHAATVKRLHATGQSVSPLGRVRRLPGVWDANEKMVGFAERASVNSPVQGMASDMMQVAAASIEGLLPGSTAVAGARLVGTVHDSILVEVPIDRWEDVTRECMDRMISIHPALERMGCRFDVPLSVEASVGTRWGLNDVGSLAV